MSSNYLWFGAGDPSTLRVLAVLSLLLSVVILVYALFIDFVPSVRWAPIQTRIVLGIGVMATIALYWAIATTRLPLSPYKKRSEKILALFVLPCLLFLLVWAAIGRVIPDSATRIMGAQKTVMTSYLKDGSHSRRRCDSRLKVAYLEGSIREYLCVTEATYERMPDKGIIVLEGKGSWFGFSVVRFRWDDPNVGPTPAAPIVSR